MAVEADPPVDAVADPSRPPWSLPAFFAPPRSQAYSYLWVRFLFLRALGLIFFSAFYSLAFQIHGLLGPRGILPAGRYLAAVAGDAGATRFWAAPTLLWLGASDAALTALVALGIAASLALVLNLWPRVSLAVSLLAFLSFIAAAQDFASYQSDGMLLEAGFLSLFFAPPGLLPGLGAGHPPSPASLWLLRWEWFRIYFESGLVKLLSGEAQWRDLSAMDKYYENGPLPTWIGWYAQQLPHRFHAATALATLITELGLVWLIFLPRRFRIAVCFATALLQIGIILTANYAFLNYLVLALGVLLLDDRALGRHGPRTGAPRAVVRRRFHRVRLAATMLTLGWAFYATLVAFVGRALPGAFLAPAEFLAPFRIANAYGLFAVMTRARYEVEFQATRDGKTWLAYPFRYKPQDVRRPPGIYAPYQPRFEWNLWFASLDTWRGAPWVVATEARLLDAEPAVLALFRCDPLGGARPSAVRTVLWQYWFTSRQERARTGAWWRREERGAYAPEVRRGATGEPILALP
ncbi:MAG TPA: lipase maturation factor family protein [Thermoanaerobaculia bacterium]|nr:lipase maturation factor family protein [Thermoanaerobaculia bacterium]